MKDRAFTLKSLLFGLLGVIAVSLFADFNETVLEQRDIFACYFPIFPVFLVFSFGILWNLLVGKINRKLALSHKEMTVVLGILFMVSWVPRLSMRLTSQAALCKYQSTVDAKWKDTKMLEAVNKNLLPGTPETDDQVLGGYLQGQIDTKAMPFAAWLKPMLHWAPLILLFSIATLALAFIVHRQWADHEQLRYPIASMADALIKPEPGKRYPAILSSKLFWSTFILIMYFYTLNYLGAWFVGRVPKVDMSYGLAWSKLFPIIGRSGAGNAGLSWIPVSFAMMGVAYLVPSSVSLTIGLAPLAATLIGIQFYLATGKPLNGNDMAIFRAGGYIAFAFILTYTGRTYYFPVLRKAFGFGKPTEYEKNAVWAARIFILSYIGMIASLWLMGLDYFIAFVLVTLLLLMFLVLTRLICETGLLAIDPGWSLATFMTGLMGPAALAAAPMAYVYFLGSILTGRNAMMPFASTALKMADDNKINLKRFIAVSKAFIMIALIAATLGTLWVSYHKGREMTRVNRHTFDSVARQIVQLEQKGLAEEAAATTGLAKLKLVQPAEKHMGYLVTGFIVVLAAYFLRFRFAKWPIHPLLFLVIWTGAASMWGCFLIGWAFKTIAVKLGGGKAYETVKPMFMGLIVGEVFAIGVTYVAGLVYYLVKAAPPAIFTAAGL